jgi:hypothetical protein
MKYIEEKSLTFMSGCLQNIHLYYSTLFNNVWILIFLKSQSL